MANCDSPNVFSWIQNLPPISNWKTKSMSTCICSLASSQPSLQFTISKNSPSQTLSFAIIADFNIPVYLWSSKTFVPSSLSTKLIDGDTISSLLGNFIEDILQYGSNKMSPFLKLPKLDCVSNFPDAFDIAFLTLSFLVCIYEAPADLRSTCLNTLKNHLAACHSRQASKLLMKLLGSNLEEQWMRSVNLAITNWILERQAAHHTLKTPSPLFSYADSTFGLWKVQLYCPVIAMDILSSHHHPADERLQFSLNYQQLEGVLQFNYKVIIKEKWIDVMLNVDNIRCDIFKLVSDNLMNERGVGAAEKHFPSRISLQVTPALQTNLGLSLSAGESATMMLNAWKFEESVSGYSANLNWFLHDSTNGKEVFSSRPSKMSLLNPKSWFRDRYSSAYRPFTRQGGVIFAGDKYGQQLWWKVDKNALGKTMEWEIRGWIWLTYWPNKHKTFYSETRRLEFREILHLNIA